MFSFNVPENNLWQENGYLRILEIKAKSFALVKKHHLALPENFGIDLEHPFPTLFLVKLPHILP